MTGEFAALARLAPLLPPVVPPDIGAGDDAAVAHVSSPVLLAADTVVAGVHADLTLTGVGDLGWKVVAANVSDVAAMGGVPTHLLVTVAGPPDTDLDRLYDGIGAAAAFWRCPVVGGDLTNAPVLVVTVAVAGSLPGPPILRSGARPGDGIWVTAPLGRAAAGLRLLKEAAGKGAGRAPSAQGIAGDVEADRRAVSTAAQAAVDAHRRPSPSVAAGLAARAAGATAMIDVSDGLLADVAHVAEASGVGVVLAAVPVAEGATEAEALTGGDDYVLVFTAPDGEAVSSAFRQLPAPIRIGTCVEDPERLELGGGPFPAQQGWEHEWR